ncbi:hypothetical protein [Rhodococcus koreensis]
MSSDDVQADYGKIEYVEWLHFQDCAAEAALAAGPLRIDVRDMELGYGPRMRTSPLVADLFINHDELDNYVDEGYEIRGYLYAIEFDNGWLKLGCTRQPMARLVIHARNYYRFHGGMRVTRMWVSIPHLSPKRSERRLSSLAARCGAVNNFPRRETGEKHGESEMYFGLNFDDFTKMADELLSLEPFTAESAERELGARRKKHYERAVRVVAIKYWDTYGTFERFVVPEPDMLYSPTQSTAPLTDVDLTTHNGLVALITRYDLKGFPPTATPLYTIEPAVPSVWTRLRGLFGPRYSHRDRGLSGRVHISPPD